MAGSTRSSGCSNGRASEELGAVDVYQSLTTVEGLRAGYTAAKESEPVQPVPDADIEATLPRLPATVADMVRLQRLTGARPYGDLHDSASLTSTAVATCGCTAHATTRRPTWVRNGESALGRKAQAILLPYLLRGMTPTAFSPAESEQKRRARQHERRRTPLSCGNRPGTNRNGNPKKTAGIATLATATGGQSTGLATWPASRGGVRIGYGIPQQRRSDSGLAWRRPGHTGPSSADVTQVYAERDMALAKKVAAEVG